ncbi:MAG: GntR family transcriptional regulator [Actinoallomurus sp.]
MTSVNLGLRSPVTQKSAAEVAAEVIRDAIVAGRLVPDQPLREAALSAELGLSRTPVREALLLLQADGLVELTPNRGARIATYTRADLEDAVELRAVIEAYAARCAATRVTPADIEELRRSCRRFDDLLADQAEVGNDVGPLVTENLAFHSLVHRSSGSRRVPQIVRGLIHLPLLYRAHAWYSPNQNVLSERHHHDITDALANHEPDRAESLMRAHVLDAGEAALAAMDTNDRASRTPPSGPSH